MTDFVLNNNSTYTSAFPPLHAWSLNNKKSYQNSQYINHHLSNHQPINSSSSSTSFFFKSLAPPKYPNYLKLTNYATLVTEQYNHLQKKKRSKFIEYNRDLEEIDFRLPQYWNKNDKSRLVDVGLNGIDLTYHSSYSGPISNNNNNESRHYVQKSLESAAIRTNFPMRAQCGIYYFEITIVSNGQDGLFAVGFCTSNNKLNKLPGYEQDSFGYHGYNGMVYDTKGKDYGPTFSSGDVVGCGIDFSNQTAFFTKNGVHLGCAFTSISNSTEYYPCVGLGSPQEKITANFGQESFAFDIVQYIKDQQKKLARTINTTTPNQSSMDELVLAYLTHQGYIETATALKKNIQYMTQVAPLDGPTRSTTDACRIEIRRAVMSGHIDTAIDQTESQYPHLLNTHPDLMFKLKTRKFLEIMIDETTSRTSSRKSSIVLEDPPVVASGRRLSWAAVAADTEETNNKRRLFSYSGRRNSNITLDKEQDHDVEKLTILRKAIEYGQELQDEYQDTPVYMDQLMDMFGLLSFTDPKSSPLAHMLDVGLRDVVASDLNNAIQEYEHHNGASNLESLYKQCVASNKELALNGHGKSSLLPVQDFLSH